MDVKDLSTESTLSERRNDVSKYTQSTAIQRNRNNLYQDIGSNSSGKVDAPSARPCAVIGPDRVIPPNDPYLKKATVEPWPCTDNVYHQRPPEYHKLYQNPSRNISPRQTFQENMQRIMVPPLYKNDEEHLSQVPDRNTHLTKKINLAADTKYCDVPYAVNTVNNDPKNVKSVDPSVTPFNQPSRLVGQGWPPGGGSLRHQRQCGPHELYQVPEYQGCVGPRPAPSSRPSRPGADEAGFMYPDPYSQEPNIRYKPYPNVKERYPPPRYDYSLSSNYPYPFHPNLQSQRYELSKSMPPQPYPGYPHFQYPDSRLSEHLIDRYARPVNTQSSCGLPYNNQIIHPVYGPMNNYPQNKLPQYPLDGPTRPITLNKLPYDSNGKVYIDYENSRLKNYHTLDNYYANDPSKFHPLKGQGVLPNYGQLNIHSLPPNPYYKKDVNPKAYDHGSLHFSNTAPRNITQFQSNTLATSPNDSVISSDTPHTHVSAQEDCGYSSQSSSTSVRSMDSVLNRVPNEYYFRHEYPYSHLMRTHPGISKPCLVPNNGDSKNKQNINVRQFLQMWNEGDDEGIEVNSSNENPSSTKEKTEPTSKNQEQLYVLGLVNVPSEELDKYEHIQKVSKLPENIKGYSNLELLNQFEQAIENTQTKSLNSPQHFEPPQPVKKPAVPIANHLSRPLSPLDVEAKISQSVIHKEVGCNFEIKPCSPKMLNVEVATPVQNIIRERRIEKIANPLSQMVKSPLINPVNENNISLYKSQRPFSTNDKMSSCKMVEPQYLNNTDTIKSNYSLQDFESNSSVCLSSLPRLDNDIDFNFPEVNQQFVNANKVTTRDLPNLDELETESEDKVSQKGFVANQSSSFDQSTFDPDTIRLSKYRKLKSQSTIVIKNDQLPSPTIRTDSVIIKNPENVRNQNNSLIHNNRTYLGEDESNDPHLTLPRDSQVSDTIMDVFSHEKPNDIAIDFSLKTDAKDRKQRIDDITTDIVNNIDNGASCELVRGEKILDQGEIDDKPYDHNVFNEEFKLPDLSDNDSNLPTIPDISERNETFIDIAKVCDLTKAKDSIDEEKLHDYDQIGKEIETVVTETDKSTEVEMLKNENQHTADHLSTKTDLIDTPKNDNKGNFNVNSNNEELNTSCHVIKTQKYDESSVNNIDEENDKCGETSTIDGSKSSSDNYINDNVTNCTTVEKNKNNETNKLSENSYINEYFERPLHSESNKEIQESESPKSNPITCVDGELEANDNIIKKCEIIKGSETNKNEDSSGESETSCNFTEVHNETGESLNENNDIFHKSDSSNFQCNETYGNVEDRHLNDEVTDGKSATCHNLIETHKNADNKEHSENKDIGQLTINVDITETRENIEKLECNENGNRESESRLNFNETHESIEIRNSSQEKSTDVEFKINCNSIKTQKEIVNNECIEDEVSASCKQNEDVLSEDEDNYEETKTTWCFVGTYKSIAERQSNANKYTMEKLEKTKHPFESNEDNELKDYHVDEPETSCSDIKENERNENQNELSEKKCDLITTNNNTEECYLKENKYTDKNYENTVEVNENSTEEIHVLKDLVVKDTVCENTGKNVKEVLKLEQTTDFTIRNLSISREYLEPQIPSMPCSPLADSNSPISRSDDINSPDSYMNDPDPIFSSNYEMHDSPALGSNADDHKVSHSSNMKTPPTDSAYSPQVNEQVLGLGFINNSTEFAVECEEERTKNSVTNISKVKFCSPNLQKLIFNWYGFSKPKQFFIDNNKKSSNTDSILTLDQLWVDNCDNDKNRDEVSSLENSSKHHTGELNSTKLQEADCRVDEKNVDIDIANEKISMKQSALEDSDLQEITLEENNLKNKEDIEITTDIPVLNEDGDIYDNTINNINSNCNSLDSNESIQLNEDNNSNDFMDSMTFECNNASSCATDTRVTLKRSYSDTALDKLKCGLQQDDSLIWPTKRKKFENTIMAQEFCNILQGNRRNSISSMYNEENVSYCILIDNSCIITDEENVDEKLCYTEYSEVCIGEENNHSTDEVIDDLLVCADNKESDRSFIFESSEVQSPACSWVDDVACVETVVSDEVAEDVFINEVASPNNINELFEDRSSDISANEHLENDDYYYGIQSYTDDESLVQTLYSGNLTENKCYNIWHSRITQEPAFDRESLEKILSDTQDDVEALVNQHNNENNNLMSHDVNSTNGTIALDKENVDIGNFSSNNTSELSSQDVTIHSCESTIDSVNCKLLEEDSNYVTSSSPEVSSTTSEEKSNILLKIKNYKGSKISQVNDFRLENENKNYKYNSKKHYLHSSISEVNKNRPLITKAAQKYIPPLRESISDLKVKLVLPQDSLIKLKKMKMSKDLPKARIKDRQAPSVVTNIVKKPKPKFEDVLKSIDELQFKKHKEKNKKVKKSIPKMIIKKAENGSHYTSTSENDKFNPDLTGRRWQPWVFIEKNQFIDKMALKKKVKAIFNHRKNTYVLAEKFHKYKSVYNTNFVISKPKHSDSSKGHLKYTIRLKPA